MSKDMMAGFELYQPDSVDGAIDLLSDAGQDGWALAGGNDSFDWLLRHVNDAERCSHERDAVGQRKRRDRSDELARPFDDHQQRQYE